MNAHFSSSMLHGLGLVAMVVLWYRLDMNYSYCYYCYIPVNLWLVEAWSAGDRRRGYLVCSGEGDPDRGVNDGWV